MLILKNLKYFRKQNIALLIGSLIATAVLTGALIVGDSVKYSLSKLVDERLGEYQFALVTGDRFVRTALASEIANELKAKSTATLLVQGISINSNNKRRINKTQILGVNNDFWKSSNIQMPDFTEDEVIISESVAEKLDLKIGNEILLRISNAGIIPLNAPFTSEAAPSIALRLKIKAIATNESLGKFSLKNIQSATHNVFINRALLARKLDLKNLSNLILITQNEDNNITEELLNESLKHNVKLKDYSLNLKSIAAHYELKSDRVFIDNSISDKLSGLKLNQDKILTYFVNSLSANEKFSPYSFVSAVSENYLSKKISDNEIVINSWLADDLKANIGDTICLKYFVIGPLRKLEENSSDYIVKNILDIDGKYFTQDLMPDLPGLTDAGNCSDWDTGIPIDLKLIRDKDENYWDEYKGTPKAFISLKKGHEIWHNKYGNYTSLKFMADETEALNKLILNKLSPKDINFKFLNIRNEGQRAATSGVDFGELFLSLSFFIIAAAVLLIVLIYSLSIESRNTETGIYKSLGFTNKLIFKIYFSESVLVIATGSVLGGIAAIFYNNIMISALNTIWKDAIQTNTLQAYVDPVTIFAGVFIGAITALLAIFFILRKTLKRNAVSIVRNVPDNVKISKSKTSMIISVLGFFLTLGLIAYSVFISTLQNSAVLLISGAMFLVGSISLFSTFLNASESKNSSQLNITSLKLAFLNAGRNKKRSVAVVALLSLGVFTVIVTGANRQTFSGSENNRKSGTGGFTFWVENTMPILHDLNTEKGKQHYGLEDEKILKMTRFVQFHNLPGDDASCLNLNQVQNPQILGVKPELFDSLQAFSFAVKIKDFENPWQELNRKYDGSVIPAIADQTVIQWGLMKSVGDTLIYRNEKGDEIKLLLIAGLKGSVFQGNILISDAYFTKQFPSASGSKMMLVDTPNDKKNEVSELLNFTLSDYGIELTSTTKRLAAFYSVTNTYLSVFMILSGLGVILGTFGLGIVIIKNILDRKHETALMQAIGFKQKHIVNLVFTENLILLTTGLIIGILSAFIGILPSLLTPAFEIPGNFLFVIILLIFISGLILVYIPSKLLLKNSFIDYLRNE